MTYLLLALSLTNPPPSFRRENPAPQCGYVVRSWLADDGTARVTLGTGLRSDERQVTLKLDGDTTITDYLDPIGPRVDLLRMDDPKFQGRYCIASKDFTGAVIAFQMSKPRFRE